MKPIRLAIEGINSFTDRQELDFEAVGRNNLFCICGKTGAGKTTIFDCIMFALYGRSGKGNLADIVNLSRMSARVELDFSVGGDMYRVERVIKCRAEKTDGEETGKRIASAECALWKNGEPHAKGEQATETIEGIIGLAENEFKNVYLLEQGEYAEFLKKQPAKQTEAVGKIFSLMRFGDVYRKASERQREATELAEFSDRRIADIGEASPELLRAVKAELAALRAKNTSSLKDEETKKAELAALEKQRDEYITAAEKENAVKKLGESLDAAKANFAVAEERYTQFMSADIDGDRKALDGQRAKLNELSALDALDTECESAENERKLKAAAHAQKAAEREAARSEIAALNGKKEDAFGAFEQATTDFRTAADALEKKSAAVENAVSALCSGERETRTQALVTVVYELRAEKESYDGLIAQRKKTEQAKSDAERAASECLSVIERYEEEIKSVAAGKEKARAELEKADGELLHAQLCSHASAVRAELSVGDICPVCGSVYNGAQAEDTDVERCKRAQATAAAALKDIEAKAAELAQKCEKAKSEYLRAKNETDAKAAELADIDGELAESRVEPAVYADMSRAIAAAKKAAEKYSAAAAEYAKRETAFAVLCAECDASEAAAAEAAAKAADLTARLGGRRGTIKAEITAVKNGIAELDEKIAEFDRRKNKLASELDAARSAVDALSASLEAARRDSPVDMPAFDEDEYRRKREAFDALIGSRAEREKDIALKDAEVKTLTEKCEKLRALNSERAEHVKRADCYAKIAEMTKGKAMLNYVAAEYIAEFTATASELLGELSGGKYAMGYDRESGFVVSDYLNGGKPRKTDTLSGGELFLASLSVAIAIARAQSNGNNAFFFLDEGFGTLDDELIDTVYGALESLSKDCLVGVISHSGALIDRMPSAVEVLEATDAVGSRIKY
ncbi:MAG: SMC family ATPase [Roseburia sp.]|nr:SMC family ATPase [Roseburia sp.]